MASTEDGQKGYHFYLMLPGDYKRLHRSDFIAEETADVRGIH
jgi:hypothetical protein